MSSIKINRIIYFPPDGSKPKTYNLKGNRTCKKVSTKKDQKKEEPKKEEDPEVEEKK